MLSSKLEIVQEKLRLMLLDFSRSRREMKEKNDEQNTTNAANYD